MQHAVPGSEPVPANVGYEVIDSTELAKRWNVPDTWVREHVRRRTTDPIPHLKLGKYCRFRWGSPELAAWLEARMVSAHVSKVVRSSGRERIQ
jgi:hypothetical protein